MGKPTDNSRDTTIPVILAPLTVPQTIVVSTVFVTVIYSPVQTPPGRPVVLLFLRLHKLPVKEESHQRSDRLRHRKCQPEAVQSETGKQKSQRHELYHRTNYGKQGAFQRLSQCLEKYREDQGCHHGKKTDSDEMEAIGSDAHRFWILRKYPEHRCLDQLRQHDRRSHPQKNSADLLFSKHFTVCCHLYSPLHFL